MLRRFRTIILTFFYYIEMKASKKQQKTDINADNSQLIELTNSLCSPSPQPTRNTRQCKTNKKNSSLD